MIIRFSDGVAFNTMGELRTESRQDGLYVVGQGMLIPVATREEADEVIISMKKAKEQS